VSSCASQNGNRGGMSLDNEEHTLMVKKKSDKGNNSFWTSGNEFHFNQFQESFEGKQSQQQLFPFQYTVQLC
jgi:hypothetical protein